MDAREVQGNILEIDTVMVRPGDTLVVRLAGTMTHEEYDNACDMIDKMLGERLPGVKAVVLNADQVLVYRPEGNDE